jgi:electron transfer flavoprotein alpha subunit
MSRSLVFVEHDSEGVLDSSLRALTLARSMAEEPVELAAAVAGEPSPAAMDGLSTYGVADAYQLELERYAPRAIGRALAALGEELPAEAVVAAGTDHGQEVIAHAAAIAAEEMAANCLAAERVESGWRLRRHRWGGSLIEEAILTAQRAFVTVAADGVAAVPSGVALRTSIRPYTPQLEEGDDTTFALESGKETAGVTLASAKVVVSGGRGVGEDGFTLIEQLAELLGGAVGVSRAVTSLGWRPHREQVGQTGTRVAPDLYLACGISGAIQHLAGCQGARTMVAINTDPEAPIMSRADYAVIGDAGEVLSALVEALRAGR